MKVTKIKIVYKSLFTEVFKVPLCEFCILTSLTQATGKWSLIYWAKTPVETYFSVVFVKKTKINQSRL